MICKKYIALTNKTPFTMKMKLCSLLLAVMLPATGLKAQSMVQSSCIGTTDNEIAFDAAPTPDGGMIYAGYIEAPAGDASPRSNGLKDFLVVKTSQDGQMEWYKNYGGSLDDIARSVAVTPQGEFIIAGCSFSDDGDITDHIGNTESCDIWIIWLNAAGELIQTKSYGSESSETAVGVRMKNESTNRIMLLAEITSESEDISITFGESDIWLAELDFNGNVNWQKTFGHAGEDRPYQLLVSQNDHIYIGATTTENGSGPGDHETFIIHTDEDGVIVWEKTIGTESSVGIGIPGNLYFDNEGQLLVPMAGSLTGDDMNCNAHGSFHFVLLDEDGMVLNHFCYGGSGQDMAKAIVPAQNGHYWILGTTDSDDDDVPPAEGYQEESTNIWLAEITEYGDQIWKRSLGGSLEESAVSLLYAGENQIIITGNTNSNNGDISGANDVTGNTFDIWRVKFDNSAASSDAMQLNPFRMYPNPADQMITICLDDFSQANTLSIKDCAGRTIYETKLIQPVNPLDIHFLSSGIYHLELTDHYTHKTQTGRLIVK